MKTLLNSLICRRPHRYEAAIIVAVTAVAVAIGAFTGATAYYNGWLG